MLRTGSIAYTCGDADAIIETTKPTFGLAVGDRGGNRCL
jgi:hypothetical protein